MCKVIYIKCLPIDDIVILKGACENAPGFCRLFVSQCFKGSYFCFIQFDTKENAKQFEVSEKSKEKWDFDFYKENTIYSKFSEFRDFKEALKKIVTGNKKVCVESIYKNKFEDSVLTNFTNNSMAINVIKELKEMGIEACIYDPFSDFDEYEQFRIQPEIKNEEIFIRFHNTVTEDIYKIIHEHAKNNNFKENWSNSCVRIKTVNFSDLAKELSFKCYIYEQIFDAPDITADKLDEMTEEIIDIFNKKISPTQQKINEIIKANEELYVQNADLEKKVENLKQITKKSSQKLPVFSSKRNIRKAPKSTIIRSKPEVL